jgi:hypothetical protein
MVTNPQQRTWYTVQWPGVVAPVRCVVLDEPRRPDGSYMALVVPPAGLHVVAVMPDDLQEM